MSSVSASAILRLPESLALLESLPAKSRNVWKWFLLLTETPRPSHQPEPIIPTLVKAAQLLNVDVEVDSANNVRFRLPASPGFENVPGVVMQGHSDMVSTNRPDVEHNWATDHIKPRVVGDWMYATGTTLGADNGLGVAAALAFFEEHASFPHGALEILVTANEETDMSGAAGLASAPYLTSQAMFNLDSEEENALCFGCAGGSYNVFEIPVSLQQVSPGSAFLEVKLFGFHGGHTGIDINKQFGNAIQVIGRVLEASLSSGMSFQIGRWKAGNAMNAIPSTVDLLLVIRPADADTLSNVFRSAFDSLKGEFALTDPGMTMDIRQVQEPFEGDVIALESVKKITDFIAIAPHGVVKMSNDVPGLVETSTSFSIARFNSDQKDKRNVFVAKFFSRSSAPNGLAFMTDKFASLARLVGASDSGSKNPFPGWTPNVKSKALQIVKNTHARVLGVDPHVYAIHAGLECGWIQRAYPGMDCVSFGPQIEGAHTVEERVNVPSVDRFWELLCASVEAWALEHS
eukprot:ANDGO_08567.mRNA.1 Cytosol non-specific dipeptidase